MLKAGSAKSVEAEIGKDIKKIEDIRDEAKSLLAEAQTRLQTIEAAVVRNTSIADSVLVLKKLSARASELPLALENAKLTEEIWPRSTLTILPSKTKRRMASQAAFRMKLLANENRVAVRTYELNL